MHSLAHYALLGSLIAGAAGAVILAVITLKHGIVRRPAVTGDGASEDVARRVRIVRLADTLAVLCFAVAAGLGVVGLTQSVRAAPAGPALVEDTATQQRIHALEARLVGAEQHLQERPALPDTRAWEERLARLEARLGAVEDRAASAERRATDAERSAGDASRRSAEADRRVTEIDRRATEVEQLARRELRARAVPSVATPKKTTPVAPAAGVPTAPIPPNASPRLNPPGSDGVRAPEAGASPSASSTPESIAPPTAALPPAAAREELGPAAVATAPPAVMPREPARVPAEPHREPARAPREPVRRMEAAPREAPRPRTESASGDVTLGEKLRRDWAIIREHAERGGDEWRDGWRRLRGLFTP